jgi:cytoskeletal protein CcmA (bactofilin family)
MAPKQILESEMFDRAAKDNNAVESQDTSNTESGKAFSSAVSPKTSRSGSTAVIGRSIQINGDLRGGEDLRIEGDVSGTVELRNNALTIGKEGKVKADVYAQSIAVDGETKGDLYATERVSIHVNARVQGNIIAPKVGIEEGAHLKGSIEMDPAEVEQALGKSMSNADTRPATEKSNRDAAAKPRPKTSAKGADTSLNAPPASA